MHYAYLYVIINFFEVNDLKVVQVMKKINLQCRSSFHIHSNVHIKLKVIVHVEYT